MATYQVQDGSVSYASGKTSMQVSFNGKAAELYEVDGNDADVIAAELTAAALADDAPAPSSVAPTLPTTEVTV